MLGIKISSSITTLSRQKLINFYQYVPVMIILYDKQIEPYLSGNAVMLCQDSRNLKITIMKWINKKWTNFNLQTVVSHGREWLIVSELNFKKSHKTFFFITSLYMMLICSFTSWSKNVCVVIIPLTSIYGQMQRMFVDWFINMDSFHHQMFCFFDMFDIIYSYKTIINDSLLISLS
jgi:hypothetical protein